MTRDAHSEPTIEQRRAAHELGAGWKLSDGVLTSNVLSEHLGLGLLGSKLFWELWPHVEDGIKGLPFTLRENEDPDAEEPALEDLEGQSYHPDAISVALALRIRHPHLRFGVLGHRTGKNLEFFSEHHYFVHDDQFAYDDEGAHPMPYVGEDSIVSEAEYNQDTWYYDESDTHDLIRAAVWIQSRGIGPKSD